MESTTSPTTDFTAVPSTRSSFDGLTNKKSLPLPEGVEFFLPEQILQKLDKSSHSFPPSFTPTTLTGSPRHSLDEHKQVEKSDKNRVDRFSNDIQEKNSLRDIETEGAPPPPSPPPHCDTLDQEGPPPDGGLQAWLVVAGTFLMIATNSGLLTSYGVFQTYYQQHQLSHMPSSTSSWIGSMQDFWVYFGSFLFGKLCDDYGPRWILIAGSTVAFVSLFLTSFCNQFYQFMLVQGFLFGTGGAMLFLPSCTIIAQYFDKRRAAAMGIIIGASSFGGVMWPLILQNLFEHPKLGFGWGTRIASFVLAGMLLISNLVMKPRLRPNKTIAKNLEKSNTCSSSETGTGTTANPLDWKSFYLVFKHKEYTIFVTGVFFMWINFFVPYFEISSYAQQVGFSTNMASRCITIMNAASLVGRLGSGPIADRWGRFNSLCIYGLLCGLSLLLFWPIPGLTQTKAGVMLLSISYGLFSGGFVSIAGACCAQISPQREIGTRLGMLWTSTAPGLLVGPVVATKLLSAANNQYWAVSLWCGLTTVLGALIVIWSRFRQTKGSLWVVI